jgi:hypothetical protein
VLFNSEVSLLIFLSWWPIYWCEWSIKVTTIIVSLCDFMSHGVCFMKLGVPTFSEIMFTLVMSSWWIVAFIDMKWPSLSLLTNFVLKSALSEMNIATSAYWGGSICLTWKVKGHPSRSAFIWLIPPYINLFNIYIWKYHIHKYVTIISVKQPKNSE